jgi:hypothetical protein
MKWPWEVIVWWEIRRLPYNVLLLVLGLLSIMTVETTGNFWVKPGEDVEEPLGIIFGAILYGIGANVGYTLGWITELLWLRGNALQSEVLRPRVFWAGLIFSAALTLLPALIFTGIWIIFEIRHHLL